MMANVTLHCGAQNNNMRAHERTSLYNEKILTMAKVTLIMTSGTAHSLSICFIIFGRCQHASRSWS